MLGYGARTYDPWLSRWTSIDPLAAKYYSTSPYVFCNNSPVNFVDFDGRFHDFIWDIASLGIGVKSLVGNIQSGNTRAAIGDGVGIIIDGIAAALPFVPGGVGVVRAGTKIADTVDNTTDAVKNFDDSFDIYKDIKLNTAKDDANISIEILPENKIDRKHFAKQKREYWKKEYDK